MTALFIMIRNLLAAFFILFCFNAGAQRIILSVTGIQEATPFSVSITGNGTEIKQFLITTDTFNVNPGTYYLLVTGTGYMDHSDSITVAEEDIHIAVEMKKTTTELGNITIVARKPLLRQEDDKTVVDAEVLSESSTNAYEVLEKTPGAIVDQDGNVYLNSATPATIQINGREMKLSATDLASLLKSLPANALSKIEILRSPSAKFDASSAGGIVNIVLKKGVKLGINGSVNAGYFQGKYGTTTAGFNINKGNEKATTYFSYQFTRRNNFEDLATERFISLDNTTISQQSYTRYPSFSNYLGAGTDIKVSDRFSFGYDARMPLNLNRSRAFNEMYISGAGNGGSILSNINNNGNSFYLGNNLHSKLKLDSLGSEWTTSIDLNFFRGDNEQDYFNRFPQQNFTIAGNGESENRKNILVLQTDAVLKLKKGITIETGGKYSWSGSRNASLYYIDKGSGTELDSFQTNRFRYREEIGSAYLQVAKTFGGLTVKPGLRMERTDINGRQQFPGDTTLSIDRTDFFPYLYLRHDLFKLFGFQLTGNIIVRRSISRPYYEILNPYPRFVDQFLYDVGNPALKPQFTNTYEFNVTAMEYPVATIGLNETKDIFTNVTYQDDETKIAYRTFDNLGSNKEFYLRLAGGIPPGGKYFFYMGGQHNMNHFKGFYQGTPLNYRRGSWVFFMYHNLKATPTLTISSSSFMRLKGFQNFYELNTFGSANLSINKAVLKRKGNIILAFNDIFRTNQYEFALQQGTVNAKGKRFNDTRRVGLSFRYNFGIKPREEKQGFPTMPEGI